MKNKENNWERYPQAQTHIEKYPDPTAIPYRIDIFTNGSLERDGSGIVAKVYGKTEEEVIKNSNLICASLDMYEALKKVKAMLEMWEQKDQESFNKYCHIDAHIETDKSLAKAERK